MQAYFGRAKAACLFSYCCNRHLCYDGGRLGRVKIVTLRVGVRAKEGKRGGAGEKKNTLFVVYRRPFALKAVFRAILNDFEFTVPIIRNSKQRTQTPSKLLKKPLLRQKDDYIPQIR